MSWKDSFLNNKNWTGAFGIKGGGYDPVIGHRGTDLAVLTLYAWEDLTVLNSDAFSPNLGYCMIVRAKDGKTFGIAHCRKGTRAANGATVKQGKVLTQMATGRTSLPTSNVNFPGYQWTGPHAHITMTDGSDVFGSSGLQDAKPRILARVKGEAVSSTGWTLAPGGETGAPYWPIGPIMERIQKALKARGRYNGVVDGKGGTLTAMGIQMTLNHSKLNGPSGYTRTPVDGKLGKNNAHGVQRYAKKYGDYRGRIDGDPRELSWSNFALGLERP